MPVKRLFIIAAAFFVLFLLLGFPAAALWRMAAADAPGLELTGLSGTVWRGRADQVIWQHAPLGELYWQWQPGWPPLRWQVTVQGPLLSLQADVSGGSGRQLDLTAVTARWSAWLMRSPLAGASLDGEFSAQLDRLSWLGQQPQHISGQVTWRQAKLVAPIAVELGQLQVRLNTTAPGDIHLDIRTLAGGALQVNGDGRLHNGRYQLRLHLRARDASNNLNQWLRQLGEPTGDGGVRVALSGALQAGAS